MNRKERYERDMAIIADLSVGMKASEASIKYGLSAPLIYSLGHAWEIDFPGRQSPTERNAAIGVKFDSGQTLQSISDEFGITRERVRQIVQKLGRKSKRKLGSERDASVVAAILEGNLTSREARERFGGIVTSIAHRHNVKFRRDRLRDNADIAARAERVANGQSIHAASDGVHKIEGLVSAYCAEHGIVSVHGRWHDRSQRGAIVRGMVAAGARWDHIAIAVSQVEGKRVGASALYAWAARHLGDDIRRPRVPREPRRIHEPRQKPVRVSRPVPNVTIAENLRDAAILNRGKAPASAIAAAHGCTRNAIIGYWFRLRQEGVIA